MKATSNPPAGFKSQPGELALFQSMAKLSLTVAL